VKFFSTSQALFIFFRIISFRERVSVLVMYRGETTKNRTFLMITARTAVMIPEIPRRSQSLFTGSTIIRYTGTNKVSSR